VGGPQAFAILFGPHDHAPGVLEARLQTGDGLGCALRQTRDEGGPVRTRFRAIVGLEDAFREGGDLSPMAARGMRQEIAHEMHRAALPGDPLERLAGGFDQARVMVGDHPPDPFQAAGLETLEAVTPGGQGLGIADPDASSLAHPVGPDARGHAGGLGHHAILFTHGEDPGVDPHERVRGRETTLVESPDPGIEAGTERAHHRLRKGGATQGLGDLGHFAGRDALHDHLHEGQHERLFAARIAFEQLRREAAVARLGDLQGHRPHPGVERPGAHPMAIALALCRPLVRTGPEVFRHLGFQDLIQDRLHPLREPLRPMQNPRP